MMDANERVAYLARTSKKAALVSAIGAVVVFASIGTGGLLLLQKDRELNQQIVAKQEVIRKLNAETEVARAAQDKIAVATREAQVALDQMSLAHRQAKAERAESQDLRDQIQAAGDANICSVLAKAVDDHPDGSAARERARAEWRASQAALLKKDTRTAEQHLQNAIAADPSYAAPYNSLGRIKAERNDLQGAEQLFLEAHKRSATYAPALANLAKVTAQTRGPAAARTYAEELVQLRPSSPLAQALVRKFGGRAPPASAVSKD